MTSRVHVFGAGAGALLAAMVAAVSANAAPAPVPDDPSAVLAEVKQSPNAKIGPWLDGLYAEYREARGKGVTDDQFRSANKKLRVADGRVFVQAMATDGAALGRSLRGMGATQVQARGPIVSARVPVRALGRLAAEASLLYARPSLATTNALPANAVSQGVVSMRADVARRQAGVDGSGTMVGTLSDSFGCNPPAFVPGAPTSTLAEDISNGELPADVTILAEGECAGATDEGRAMGQIVHDVAPGASIAFHTAFNSEFDFAEGIIELERAGADVIVDDVRYFAEPFFMDGMIAQAVDIVYGRGVPYFSSAGNQARDSYESAYRGVNVVTNAGTNLNGGNATVRRFHDFDPGPGVSILQPVAVYPSDGAGYAIFSFQWDQPHRTATTYAWLKAGKSEAEAARLAKGAVSDMDLVIFDYKGHVVRRCPPGVATGITCQVTGDRNIGGDAVDLGVIYYAGPPKTPQLFYVALVNSGGPDPGVVKYNWWEQQGEFEPLAFNTNSGTSFGHSNAAGNIAVGAASWYASVPFSTSGAVPPNDKQTPKIDLRPCAPACLNDFSSAGSVPIYFDRFGNRLASPVIRRVPSVTGPDGGNSTFFLSDSSYDDDDGDGSNSPLSTFITPTLDLPGDEYPNFFGTSAAAPHVAAVAALMLDKNPNGSPAYIRRVLERTARPIGLRFTSNRPLITWPITSETGPAGFDFDSGFGLVDAARALQVYDVN
ncbi:MAG: S8 family serine peptidase [Gammaproteobacteria bacterium]|nr:S8 family serine peptidase [Gammaproteobacteria bacterium]